MTYLSVVTLFSDTITRLGTRSILERTRRISVIGEEAAKESALELLKAKDPDVLFTECGKMDELHTISNEIRDHKLRTKIVLLGRKDSCINVPILSSIGVNGFISRESSEEHFINVLGEVAKGYIFFEGRKDSYRTRSRSQHVELTFGLQLLTKRERQILHLIGRGKKMVKSVTSYT